jgi:hypothetical protein
LDARGRSDAVQCCADRIGSSVRGPSHEPVGFTRSCHQRSREQGRARNFPRIVFRDAFMAAAFEIKRPQCVTRRRKNWLDKPFLAQSGGCFLYPTILCLGEDNSLTSGTANAIHKHREKVRASAHTSS